jgi:hypothetical protein
MTLDQTKESQSTVMLRALNVKDVHSCAYARTLFTFWTAIFVKYDILTEYLTLFWFAILVNEYKLYVSLQKSSKDAKFGQCLYPGVPLCYRSRTDAQNGVDIITNILAGRWVRERGEFGKLPATRGASNPGLTEPASMFGFYHMPFRVKSTKEFTHFSIQFLVWITNILAANILRKQTNLGLNWS